MKLIFVAGPGEEPAVIETRPVLPRLEEPPTICWVVRGFGLTLTHHTMRDDLRAEWFEGVTVCDKYRVAPYRGVRLVDAAGAVQAYEVFHG